MAPNGQIWNSFVCRNIFSPFLPFFFVSSWSTNVSSLLDLPLDVIVWSDLRSYCFRGVERSDFGIRLCAVTFFPFSSIFLRFLRGRRTLFLWSCLLVPSYGQTCGIILFAVTVFLFHFYHRRTFFSSIGAPIRGPPRVVFLPWCALLLVFAHFLLGDRVDMTKFFNRGTLSSAIVSSFFFIPVFFNASSL